MNNIIKLIITIGIFCSPALQAAKGELPELTQTQQLRLESFITGVYNLNALDGPFPPHLCLYSLFWDEYYVPVEQGLRELLAPLSQRERKELDKRLFNLAAWWVLLDELGCGDYDPTKIYDLLGADGQSGNSK